MKINCKGNLIDLTSPKVMGILNFTPDSFYDGGKYKSDIEIITQVEKMIVEGADFIDIGAYSSRPNAAFVSEQEEINRITSVLSIIQSKFPNILISIDTFRSEVARVSLENGAAIINDISAGSLDERMWDVVAQHNVPYIMMHMKGTPQNMQEFTQYDDILKEILFYFSEKVKTARSRGINDIILDVGFGFSKTLEQNYELLNKLELFNLFELPTLVGVSRKSMIYKALNINPTEALNGTTVINTISLLKGASILRVHDVKQAKEAIDLVNRLK